MAKEYQHRFFKKAKNWGPVSYTHLDVYKRQVSPANPDTLESVSALSLQGEKVAQIKSFSFYVKNTDTGEILSPDDLDQFGAPPKGQVIAVQNGSDTGYVIGSFSFPYERYGWGSISDLQDGTFCYTCLLYTSIGSITAFQHQFACLFSSSG